jgi:hypothetical protein
MPYPIICVSCGYHRAWTAMADAMEDGRHHVGLARPALPAPILPVLPHTRCCPFCGSDQIAVRRLVPDGAGMSKVEQWCAACKREFVFLR